jgi:K+-sensing histidine kinase KdpD
MHRLDRLFVEIPALRPGSLGAYSFAVTLAACATGLRLGMDPVVEGVQYITFFPAVIITTYVSGMRAGFLSMVLCAAAAWAFVLPPYGRIDVANWHQLLTIAFFMVVAGLDVLLVGALRFAIARYRALADRSLADRGAARE